MLHTRLDRLVQLPSYAHFSDLFFAKLKLLRKTAYEFKQCMDKLTISSQCNAALAITGTSKEVHLRTNHKSYI